MIEPITEDWITCPYCLHQVKDSSEYPDRTEMECSECDKEYVAYRNVSVCYTMIKKETAK